MKTYHLGELQDLFESKIGAAVDIFGHQILDTDILKRFHPADFSIRCNEWIDHQLGEGKLARWSDGSIRDEAEPKPGAQT